MNTLNDLFGCWGTLTEMASDLDESPWAVAKWRQRKRIPQGSWGAVINAAKRRGKDISADDLLAMHSKKPPSMSAACK